MAAAGKSGAAGTIAFVRDDGASEDIWLMADDGSALRRLTSGPGDERWPAWSDDGSQIVYVSSQDGESSLWVVDADGHGERRLTDGNTPEVSHPSWGGDRILFQGGQSEVWHVRPDGSELRHLRKFDGFPFLTREPSWGLGGEVFALRPLPPEYRNEIAVSGIMRSSLSGDVVSTMGYPFEIWNLSVQRHGGYVYCFDSAGDIWMLEMGEERQNLTASPGTIDTDPAWSPDEREIVYVSDGWITTMLADGSSSRRLSQGSQPAWGTFSLKTAVVNRGWGEVKRVSNEAE